MIISIMTDQLSAARPGDILRLRLVGGGECKVNHVIDIDGVDVNTSSNEGLTVRATYMYFPFEEEMHAERRGDTYPIQSLQMALVDSII